MEVVLLEPISKLGKTGDIVNVKNGYARNFLIPRGAALRATNENIAIFESQKKDIEAKNADKQKIAEALAKKVNDLNVTIIRQAAEDGRLYGSVTVREIAEHIVEQGFAVESKQIDLLNPIKTVGASRVRLTLHAEVTVEITVNVARSEAEAESQLHAELAEDKEAKEAERQAAIDGALAAADAALKAQEAREAAAEAGNSEGKEASEEKPAE